MQNVFPALFQTRQDHGFTDPQDAHMSDTLRHMGAPPIVVPRPTRIGCIRYLRLAHTVWRCPHGTLQNGYRMTVRGWDTEISLRFALVSGFLLAFSGVGFSSPSPVRVGPRPRDHSKTISQIWEKSGIFGAKVKAPPLVLPEIRRGRGAGAFHAQTTVRAHTQAEHTGRSLGMFANANFP